MSPLLLYRVLPMAAIAFGCCTAMAGAVTVFTSNFTADPTPNFVFSGSAGSAGYVPAGLPGSTTGRAIEVVDTSTTLASTAVLTPTVANGAPAFDTTLSGQGQLRFTADFAVTSFSGSGSNVEIPRVIFGDVANPANVLHIGLGRTSGGNAILYAGKGTSSNPSDGTTRILLFNYGTHNTGDASVNDTNDLYVTLTLTYSSATGAITITAANAAVSGSGTFTGFTGFNNDNLTLSLTSGIAAQSTAYLDNVTIETLPIPEPAASVLGSLGALGLLIRRRR